MRVYFFLYSPFRINLYQTLINEYKKLGYTTIVIAQDLHTYFHFKRQKIITYLFRIKSSPEKNYNCKLINESIDIKSEHLDIKRGLILAYNFSLLLNGLHINKNDIIFAGNGYHIQDKLLLELRNKNRFKLYFSELSNLDNKTFFDINGSNASSNFFKHIKYKFEHEKNTSLNQKEEKNLLNWKKEYISKKEHSHIVRQAKKMSLSETIKRRILNILELLFNIPSFSTLKYKSKNFKKIMTKQYSIPSDPLPEGYYFLPLQVTDDSQIKINSKYDNNQSIQYFLDQALSKGKFLVIKFHPAEKNTNFIDFVIKISKKNNIIISTENTFALMKNADKICVINSTAGFEGILLDKEVEFIGISFYKYLTKKHLLYYYLFEYLFDVDFFTGQNYEINIIKKLERLYEK